jgi:transposase
VVEEITAAGFVAHLAEPAETQTRRGRKKRAKTDRSDARLQRELLARGELPESWIPPTVVLEWRERTRLYKSLLDQRPSGCNGSTPSCSNTGSRPPKPKSVPRRPGRS